MGTTQIVIAFYFGRVRCPDDGCACVCVTFSAGPGAGRPLWCGPGILCGVRVRCPKENCIVRSPCFHGVKSPIACCGDNTSFLCDGCLRVLLSCCVLSFVARCVCAMCSLYEF